MAALTLAIGGVSLAAAQTPGQIIRGTVRDSATGQELSGAVVELTGPLVRTVARSDQRGTFQFSRVADGRYHVSARLIGFAESGKDVEVAGRDVSLSISLSPTSQRLDTVRGTIHRKTNSSEEGAWQPKIVTGLPQVCDLSSGHAP